MAAQPPAVSCGAGLPSARQSLGLQLDRGNLALTLGSQLLEQREESPGPNLRPPPFPTLPAPRGDAIRVSRCTHSFSC